MPAWAKQDKGRQWEKQRQKSTRSLSLGLGVLSYQPLACGYTIRRWEKIGAGKGKSTFQRDWVLCGALSIPCHCFTFLWPCTVPFGLFCSFPGPLMPTLSVYASREVKKPSLLPPPSGATLHSSLPHWLPISLALTAEIIAVFSLPLPLHFFP